MPYQANYFFIDLLTNLYVVYSSLIQISCYNNFSFSFPGMYSIIFLRLFASLNKISVLTGIGMSAIRRTLQYMM